MLFEPQLYWLVLGFVLILAELTMGNFILFFLGLACVSVGAALWLGFPNENGMPFLLFAGLAILFLVTLRARMKQHFVGDVVKASDDEDFVGFEVKIESGFDHRSPGRGRVQYRGASWDAKSAQAEFAHHSLAEIVDRKANILIIAERSK